MPEIFRDSGESEFRRAEHAALKELLKELRAGAERIVALGGGAFVQKHNARLIEAGGIPTVFLDAERGGIVAALPAAGGAARNGASIAG